jgi:hypothetical protein
MTAVNKSSRFEAIEAELYLKGPQK